MNPAEAQSDDPADIQRFFTSIVGGRGDRASSSPSPQARGQRQASPSPGMYMEMPSADVPAVPDHASTLPPAAGVPVDAPYFMETSSDVPANAFFVQSPAATDPGPISSSFGPPLGGSPPQVGQYAAPLPMDYQGMPNSPAPYAQQVVHSNAGLGQRSTPVVGPDEYYPIHYGKKPDKSPLDVMGMFATLFTALLVCTFITPLFLSYHVGSDEQVQFWIGSYINWVFILPPLYVVTHVYHIMRKKPAKLLVVLSLIGSCVVILILSDRVLLDAYDRANEFYAKDCDTFPRKRDLQREWDAAHAFYANCMAEVSKGLDISFEAAIATYRLKDCKDYQDMLGKHPSWEYLGRLEEGYSCSGWCSREQPLWTLGQVKDSCSATVADILRHKVQWCMLQVVIYTIFALAMVSTSLIFIGPSLWGHRKRESVDA